MKSFLSKLSDVVADDNKSTCINDEGHLVVSVNDLRDLVITKEDCDTKRIENLVKKMKKYSCTQVDKDDALSYTIPSSKIAKWDAGDSDKNIQAVKNKQFKTTLFKMVKIVDEMEISGVKEANKMFNKIITEVSKVYSEAEDYNLTYNQDEVVLKFDAGDAEVCLKFDAQYNKLSVSC